MLIPLPNIFLPLPWLSTGNLAPITSIPQWLSCSCMSILNGCIVFHYMTTPSFICEFLVGGHYGVFNPLQ